jgi:hypothetical protein
VIQIVATHKPNTHCQNLILITIDYLQLKSKIHPEFN